MKTFVVYITEDEIKAIISLKDDCEAMLGGGDENSDRYWEKYIKSINEFLKENGLE